MISGTHDSNREQISNHHQMEPEKPAATGDIYAALRDMQGPTVSEELPKLELPVSEQALPENAHQQAQEQSQQVEHGEEDDDFGDFEEAKPL